MDKRYLPVVASVLILAIAFASVLPVFAVTVVRARANPTLVVVTIPEDDEIRKTGMIVFADSEANFRAHTTTWPEADLLAQYKLLVSYNGVPVTPTAMTCQIIEKDKANPVKDQQKSWENLKTVPVDQTGAFVCKVRWGKPGVGVIDIYFKGTPSWKFISDYVVVIGAVYTIGRTYVYGYEIQDVCVLGWPLGTTGNSHWTKPDGDQHYVYPNPLGSWVSCEEAALYQKHYVLGYPIPWT